MLPLAGRPAARAKQKGGARRAGPRRVCRRRLQLQWRWWRRAAERGGCGGGLPLPGQAAHHHGALLLFLCGGRESSYLRGAGSGSSRPRGAMRVLEALLGAGSAVLGLSGLALARAMLRGGCWWSGACDSAGRAGCAAWSQRVGGETALASRLAPLPAPLQSEGGEASDAVSATRARIDALKLSGRTAEAEDKAAAEGGWVPRGP